MLIVGKSRDPDARGQNTMFQFLICCKKHKFVYSIHFNYLFKQEGTHMETGKSNAICTKNQLDQTYNNSRRSALAARQ